MRAEHSGLYGDNRHDRECRVAIADYVGCVAPPDRILITDAEDGTSREGVRRGNAGTPGCRPSRHSPERL